MRILTGEAALRRIRKLERRGSQLAKLEPQVRTIVEDVRRNGDRALRKYAQKWDGLGAEEDVRGSAAELEAAWTMAAAQLRASLRQAATNIRRFCEDQIVGPGNGYVTLAKKLLSFDCAIDFLAGPTEVVILSNAGRAEFIAADLVAQAEHDPAAIAIFITTSRELARGVSAGVERIA